MKKVTVSTKRPPGIRLAYEPKQGIQYNTCLICKYAEKVENTTRGQYQPWYVLICSRHNYAPLWRNSICDDFADFLWRPIDYEPCRG